MHVHIAKYTQMGSNNKHASIDRKSLITLVFNFCVQVTALTVPLSSVGDSVVDWKVEFLIYNEADRMMTASNRAAQQLCLEQAIFSHEILPTINNYDISHRYRLIRMLGRHNNYNNNEVDFPWPGSWTAQKEKNTLLNKKLLRFDLNNETEELLITSGGEEFQFDITSRKKECLCMGDPG